MAKKVTAKTNDKAVVKKLADRLLTSADVPVPEPSVKICSRCEQLLPKSAFAQHKDTADGLMHMCRACRGVVGKSAIDHKNDRVTLDFMAHPDLLKTIRNLAFDEMRSVDKQIMFFLKNNLPARVEE